ncbi:SDR family oxidoreductase [Paracoccaceae bacterium Fryx2]|nr:SDR family oxidoreductase [Paracoccaceae bacterium Fryx2]
MTGVAGCVALVTGCGSAGGIGFATAQALAAAGARVAITAGGGRIFDRQAALGEGHRGFVADLCDAEQVRGMVAAVRTRFGGLDIVVTTAEAPATEAEALRIEDMADADWQAETGQTLTAAFNVTRAVLPGMQVRGFGRIVHVAPVTGALAGSAGLGAARAALTGLTRRIAQENAALGITCNAVLPGWIVEPPLPEDGPGRPGLPQDVAAACLFLAGRAAGFINGATLVVDGGHGLGGDALRGGGLHGEG